MDPVYDPDDPRHDPDDALGALLRQADAEAEAAELAEAKGSKPEEEAPNVPSR